MSNEEHCGEKKVYYCRDSGLLEHPLSNDHPIDILISTTDRLCILLNIFSPEHTDDGPAVTLTVAQADAYHSLVQSIVNDLVFATSRLEYEPQPLELAA